jgi:hypothetical protein
MLFHRRPKPHVLSDRKLPVTTELPGQPCDPLLRFPMKLNPAQIPAASYPLEDCCYCWYAANPAVPFPARLWTATICDDHLALYFPRSRVMQHSGSDRRLPLAQPLRYRDLLASLAEQETLMEVQ